jgi:CRISPR-associated protein Csd2
MFEHDRSAARGQMSTRRLVIFEHDSALGSAHANDLFDRVTWKRTTEGPARSFTDYEISLDGQPMKGLRTLVPAR